MLLHMCKSKIHRATITQTALDYEGSLTLDPVLMEEARILSGERVQVVNLNNGARLETYVIEGERGSGTVCLNGPAARLGEPGDAVIVIAYCLMSPQEAREHRPIVVRVDANNRVTSAS
ncbi:MAG: aspartate 1-decarboxylase [Armatimonadota bacterium]